METEYKNIKQIQKRINTLAKKYKNKKIVLYGAGKFFQEIHKLLDFSELNIVGIADLKFNNHDDAETFLGYNVCSLSEAIDIKPDLLLVTLKFYTKIIEDLYFNKFFNTETKIRPLVKKGFIELFKEYAGLNKIK